MNVIQAITQAATEIGAVKKNEQNRHQGFNFRGIDAVVNASSAALHRAGVVVIPEVIEKEIKESRTAKGAVMCNVYLTVKYHFHGPEGDTVTATVPSESFDSGDKATAKAMSVALRTAMLQVLMLPTDEPDPDEHSYERAPEPEITSTQANRLADLWDTLEFTAENATKSVTWASQGRTTDPTKLTQAEADRIITELERRLNTKEVAA